MKDCTQHLNRLDDTKVTSKARELIIRRLPVGDPSRAEIARALCISERTLQRRLQVEGTSYHALLDDTRKELVQQYLFRDDLTLVQITVCLVSAIRVRFRVPANAGSICPRLNIAAT